MIFERGFQVEKKVCANAPKLRACLRSSIKSKGRSQPVRLEEREEKLV